MSERGIEGEQENMSTRRGVKPGGPERVSRGRTFNNNVPPWTVKSKSEMFPGEGEVAELVRS